MSTNAAERQRKYMQSPSARRRKREYQRQYMRDYRRGLVGKKGRTP